LIREYFAGVANSLTSQLQGDEVYTAYLAAEDSDFCRFNHGRIRQVGHVVQQQLTLSLISRERHIQSDVMLTGAWEIDRDRIRSAMSWMRAALTELPEDPFMQYAREVRNTELIQANRLPSADEMVSDIVRQADGLDLVGFLGAGGIYRGFANSLGQRNWYETYSHNFGWSCYLEADKATKSSYAGFEWDSSELASKIGESRQALADLARPQRDMRPGKYRAYLAPAAVSEITDLLGWSSFGVKAQRTMQSPLIRLVKNEQSLHSAVNIAEHTAQGVAPNFDGAGFIRPERVELISGGRHVGALASSRSAREFGVDAAGCNSQESPESLEILPGSIDSSAILEALGTGLYINHLWYMNYSDQNACRMTGMTRFATFWVENGEVVAPVPVMRFDETLYDLLGKNLVGFTDRSEFILGSSTYLQRATTSSRLPGALVETFNLTL
jgi:predicted Zn-dependent protease